MNEISVPVKLQIQNLQSLMSDLQGKLSNLKVGSAGFKNLQSVISAIGNEIDRLQVQTSKPFMSEAQFKTAERSVERLEDQIEKLGLSVSRIKFSDLNLTPQQQSDIKGFEDQLESIKANLKMVKDTAKQEFLNTDLGKQWATIDSTAFSKSLSQITANIRSEVKKQQDELNKLQETATSYQNALKQNNSIKKFLKDTNKDPISASSMGQDLYDQLFNKNGILKSGKNSGKKLIEQWLEQQLELDPEIISRLVNKLNSGAGRNISTQLTEALQKIMKDNSAVIKANPTAEVDFKQKEQEVQNLINILREAGVSEQSIVVAEQALRQQLDSTKQSFNEYQQAAARAAQEHMNIDSTTAAFKSQLTSLRSTLDQTNAKFLQMQRTTQSFNQMKMAITNFMGFNQVLNITKNAVREAMNHIKELDSVMNGISIVTDMTTDDLWKQVDAYSEMAQNYGVSIKGAYEVSQIYYQQGLETNDVLTLTNETLKLAKISGLDYAQTTDYMTTALRGFKMEMSDASTIVDVYSNLAANTAVSQEELAVAMSKTASSMESVGSSFEDTSAMIATMVAVTRESATNIGSAMKSIASRYGELTKDPTKLVDADGEAMAFNKVDSALQSVGISMKTVDGQFRNFTDVIVELAEKWDQLESTQQRYIATQFAGNRQQSRFLALVSNKDILKANMEVANNSEDVGTLQALKALDSIEAKTEQVRVAYQQFYTTIGMQDVWKTFLDGTKNVINTLNSLPKLFNSIPIGAVAAIANTISLVKTLLNAGLNILANNFKNILSDSFNQAEQSSKDGGIKVGRSWWQSVIQEIRTGKPAIQAEMSEAMNPTNQQNTTPNMSNTINNSASGKFTNFVKALGNSGTKLHGIMTGLSSVLTTVGMVIKKDTVEGQKLAGTITSIGGTLQGLTGVARIAMNPADLGGWLQTAQGVMNLVNGIGLAWETAEEKLERLNKEAEELSNEAKEVKANYNILDRSVKKLKELKDKQYESEEAAEEYKSVMNEIAEKYPELIQGFDEVGNAIVDVDEAERRLADARHETAKATYEALEKEREAQKQSLDNQKEKIDEYSNKVSEDSYGEYLNRKEQNRKEKEQINPTSVSENSYRFAFEAGHSGRDIATGSSYHLSNFFRGDEKGKELAYILGFSQEDIDTFGELSEIKNALANKDFSENKQITPEIVDFLRMFGITLNGLVSDTIESTLDDVETVYNFILSLNKNEKISLEDFEKFRKAYNKLSEEDKNNLGISQEEIKDLTEKIQTYVSDSNKYASTDKLTIQSWLKYKQAEEKGYDWINTSSYSLILLSEKLSELAEGKEYESVDAFMEGEEAAKGIVEAYNDFYNSLNETQKEIYEKYLKDSSSYTEEDLWKRLGETADPSKSWSEPASEVKEIVEKGIESTKQSKEKIRAYYEGITEPLRQTENLYKAIESSDSNISSEYSQLMIQALEEVQATKDTDLATKLSNAYQKLFEEINKATPEIRNIIIDTILSGNLLTKEGILDILSKLKQTSPEAASYVEEYLNQISNLRKTNIVSLSQALLADAEEEVEKTGKLLSKANKQMSGKEAASFIDYINGLGLTDESENLITIDYGDFDPDASGKLAVKDQVLIELQDAFEKSLFNRLGIVDEAIKKYKNLFSQDKNTKQISLIKENINNLEGQEIDSVENLIDFLESNDIALDGLINDQRIITAEGAKIIQQKAQEVVNSYNNTVKAYGLLFNSFIQDSKWAQGIYKFDGKEYGREELIKLANDNFIPKEETDSRGAKEYINSHYNTFVTDVLKKGFESINMDDYEGLYKPDEIKKDLTGSYVNFIKKYGQYLGLSVEELNDLLVEAIEKDREATSGAAQEALSKIDFYGKNGKAFGKLEDIKQLAAALNRPLEELLGQYNAGLDQFEVKLKTIDYKDITNHVNIIRDSIRSVFDSITKYVTSAIEGKFQYKDITNLNAQLDQLGISHITVADFTKTADGLKLSQQAAIHLYDELSKIDSIQGRIIFNDLNKNLKESNEHYRTTRDILEHIKDLRTQIKSLEGKNTTKIEQYKEELALAEKIVQVRTVTEDDSYKFMDNKLEGGLANAVNYFNALGNAQKAWNEAIQDAQERQKAFQEGTSSNNDFNIYFDIDKFKAIVEELNRLAGQSGKEIEFLGHKLNGELSSASELIQAGLNTVVFDGDSAKVNLSELGVSLLDGGKLLNKNSQEAVREFAKSQITIIDGLIGITDTIIAFEKIGEIDVNDNKQFDFLDVFKTENGYSITDQFKEILFNLIGDENTKKVLSNIKLSYGTLLDLIKAMLSGDKALEDYLNKLNLSTEDLFKIFKVLAEKRDWGDINGADLTQLFEQVIGETSGMVYDASNTKQIIKIKGKPNIVIDWEQDSTKQALEQFNSEETEEKRKKRLIEALQNYESADGLNVVDSSNQLMAVLRYKGIVTDIRVDNQTKEVIMTYNGKEYKGESQQEVLQKALLTEGGAQIIAQDTGSEQLMGAITFGSAAIKMVLGNNGKITYSLGVDDQKFTGSSLDAIKEQYINYVLKSDTTKTQQEVELDWNTKINMNSSVVGEISQGIRDALKEIGANLDTPLITITPKETKIKIPKNKKPSIEDPEETVPTEVEAPKEQETITISYNKLIAMLKAAGVQDDKIQPILDELDSNWKKNGDTPIEIIYKSLETALKNNGVNDTVLPNIKRLWAAWHDPSYSKVVVDVNTLEAKLTSQGFTEDQVKAAIGAAKTGWETEGGKSVEIKPESLTAALSSDIDDSAINSAITAAQKQWKENGEKPVNVYPNLNIITTKTIKDENGEEIEVSIVDQLANAIESLDSNLTPEQKTAVITDLMMTLSQIKDLSEEDQEKLQTVINTAASKLKIAPETLTLNLTAAKLITDQISESDLENEQKLTLEQYINNLLNNQALNGQVDLSNLIINSLGEPQLKQGLSKNVSLGGGFEGSGTLKTLILALALANENGIEPTQVKLDKNGLITLSNEVESATGGVKNVTLIPSKDGTSYTLDITEVEINDEGNEVITTKTISISNEDLEGTGTLASLILNPPIDTKSITVKNKDGTTSITVSTVDEAKGEVTTLTITNVPTISNVTGTVSEAQVSADTAHLTIKKVDANGNEIESTEIDIPANVLFGSQKQSLLDYLTSITNDQKVINLLGEFDSNQIQKALDKIGPKTIKINGESGNDWNSSYGEDITLTTGEGTFGGRNPGDWVAAQQAGRYELWNSYTGGSPNAQEAALKKADELRRLTDAAIALYNQAQNDKTVVEKIISSLENIDTKNVDTVSKTLKELNTTQIEKIKQYSDTINTTPAFNAMSYINSIRPDGAQAAQAALNSITGNVAIDVQFNVGIDGAAEATGNIVGARLNGQNIDYSPYSVNTKINKSYAKGSRRTLMGELGPELVVSGGRYYVVGQNGAEMVDLDPDAIVFNHLQTKKLLSTGHAGRGKPVTNERVATSLATGNVGPAMASASEIRETLKTMRDIWKAMLESPLRALGSQAGLNTKLSNKKNNGGNGNSNNDKPNTIDAGYIADLERWYNLLRQIDKLEKDINYQEQLRSKIESDRAINGKAYYESQKQSLKEIEEEAIARQQLVVLQKSYYDKRRKELTESPFGKIFTFNEDGLMQYNDQGLLPNRERGGLAALAKLNATNPDNSSVFTPREQYNLLVEWGFEDLLKYDNSGKLIELTDEKGNPREEGYVEAVQSFWDQADGIKDELDSLYDSYRDQQEQILAADQKRNEILQNIVNNQLAVEDKVYKALVDLKESEIENAEKEKDALQKSSDEFIDGLNKQLNKEREMYKNNQEEAELTKLRRQLAILRRSGGSASQIRGLQDQISAKEQDQYFNAQQQQIDAVKEASDLQIKKMDQQITIMRETLEYQKAQGLLYGEVSKIMSGSAESINSFITTFDKDWKTYSATKWQEEYNLLNSSTTQWVSYLQDETGYRKTAYGTLVNVKDAIEDKEGKEYSWRVYDESMYKLLGEDWNTVKGQVKSIYDGHYGETADPNFAAAKATETQEVQNLITGDDNTIYLNPEGDDEFYNQPEDNDYSGGNGSNGGSYGNNSYSAPSVETPKKEDKKSEKPVVISTGDWESDDTHHWRTQQLSDGNTRMAYYAKHKYSGPITNGSKCNVCGRMVTSYSPINTPTKPDTEPNSSPSGTYKTSKSNQAIYDNGTVYHKPNQSSSSSGNSTNNSIGYVWIYYKDNNTNNTISEAKKIWNKHGTAIYPKAVKINIPGYTYVGSDKDHVKIIGGSTQELYLYYKLNRSINATGTDRGSRSKDVNSVQGFSTGGMVDYTGLAMLHGSKTRPETVLNADETKMWREKILSGHSNSLTNQLLNFQNLVNGLSLNLSGVNNTTNEGSVNIEHVEFNMNASIANDYDAKRAGQNAFEEMMKIARKNGVQSVSRR